MPTLREYFTTELPGPAQSFDYFPRVGLHGRPITVRAQVHFNFAHHVRYVSYFVPEGQYVLQLALFLARDPQPVLDKVSNLLVQFQSNREEAVYCNPVTGGKLPFSGRIFLYIDEILSDEDKAELVRAAESSGINLQIKDKQYSNYQTLHEKPWAFISHDSRDKDPFVKDLAAKLRSMMCPVWYDEYSLKIGQSLRESIDKGLQEASKCILVLSPNFFSNPGWAKGEFNAAMNKHFSGDGSVVLPIWLNVSKAEVAEYSPLIADVYALNANMNIDELARSLFLATSPS
jgi:hypothetical protein